MLFNSVEFFVFLALVYAAYRVLPFRAQNIMLLVASYVFYGWWDMRFLFLMAFSTTIDFWAGLTMHRGRLATRDKVVPAVFISAAALLFLGMNAGEIFPGQARAEGIDGLVRTDLLPLIAGGLAAGFTTLSLLGRWLTTLAEVQRRKACLIISVVTQLTVLGFFKYYNFFVDSMIAALGSGGVEASSWSLDIILPVGISFYTFQSISYAIDIYRREITPTRRFFDFALFVAFFPQLVAGPIERAKHLLPQISMPRHITFDESARGVFLIVVGLFKKVAVADGVAPIVDQIFGSGGFVSWIDVVIGTLLFAIQIYCDFSGYSDIARGVSKLFGVDLMINFNLPYFARGPSDFWRRWHISLSTWLKDYLYIPLGGNRGSSWFTGRNLMITMVLGGLWHGAAWNYVLWGFYQGTLLCIARFWGEWRPKPAHPTGTVRNAASIAFFFIFVCYGWLLFRAHSFEQIVQFTGILFTDFGNLDYGGGIPRISALLGIPLLAAMELYQYLTNDRQFERRLVVPVRAALIAVMLTITLMGTSNEPAQFIYFQF
jgi:alginate O-acetyltransferase complex protein AlgI